MPPPEFLTFIGLMILVGILAAVTRRSDAESLNWKGQRIPNQCRHGVAVSSKTPCALCKPPARTPAPLILIGVVVLGAWLALSVVIPKGWRSVFFVILAIATVSYFNEIAKSQRARKIELDAWRVNAAPCAHGVEGAKRRVERCPACLETHKVEQAAVAAEAARQFEAAAKERERRERAARERDRILLEEARHIERLRVMEPMEFQNFIWLVYRRLGFEVEETPSGNDGGVDGFLRKDGETFVLQCKRYQNDVGEPVLRDLFGTMHHHKASGAILVTTGRVSEKARLFCRGKRIELIDHETILELIGESHGSAHEYVPTEMSFEETECPRCGSALRMVRTRAGKVFIGCTGYPVCRYTRDA